MISMRLIRVRKPEGTSFIHSSVQVLSESDSHVDLCLQTIEGKDVDQVRAGSKQTKCQGRY